MMLDLIPNIRGLNFFYMFRKKNKKEKEKKGARGRVLTVKNKVNESNDQDDEDLLHLMLKATRVPYKYPTLSLHSLTPL